MSAVQPSQDGPRRLRLTAAQTARGAEMFGLGATTREVAAELRIGRGTASRLRQRLVAQDRLPSGAAAAATAAPPDG